MWVMLTKWCLLNLLSNHTLDLQGFFFKMTMCHNFEPILCEENDFNPLTKLWHGVFGSLIFNHKLVEYIKLAEIAIV
jgi:hypothetical protein